MIMIIRSRPGHLVWGRMAKIVMRAGRNSFGMGRNISGSLRKLEVESVLISRSMLEGESSSMMILLLVSLTIAT